MVTENLYGLALCGGKSSRMGTDKSLLNYHGKPQCYHVYEMLTRFCEASFISCNSSQLSAINKKYKAIEDNVFSRDMGPVSGILTACKKFPGKDWLVIGCDYPFLDQDEIELFLSMIDRSQRAAAFYDDVQHVYQPVLAWYSSPALRQFAQASVEIGSRKSEIGSRKSKIESRKSESPQQALSFSGGPISLQKLLISVNAAKYTPRNPPSMFSADTKEEADEALIKLNQVLIKN